MLRDDVSRLYKYMGQSAQNYLDLQTEVDFNKRLAIVTQRHAGFSIHAPSSTKRKVIAVVSMGGLPGRKLVSSLAFLAAQRLQNKIPVQVIDLIPTDNHAEKSIFSTNGIKHVLIDASAQSVRMKAGDEITWLGREIGSETEEGLIFVDVPERVMHMRAHAMTVADLLLVLVPATSGAVRAIEEMESEMSEVLQHGVRAGVSYLLIAEDSQEMLSTLLVKDLLAHQDLFVPHCLKKESMPSAQQLATGTSQNDSAELSSVLDYIFGKFK